MASRLSALRSLGPAVLGVGVLGVGVLTTGTAYAFWTTTGTGNATATAAAALPLSVTVSADGPLHPGATASATAAFTNPNPFAVTVTSITPGAVTVTSTTGCTAANSGVSFAPLTGSWTVPAKAAAGPGTLTDVKLQAAVRMALTSDNGCQSASFSATLTAAGSSS